MCENKTQTTFELFSCPHSPLVCCFSQPLLPLPLCLCFSQLRNSDVGTVLQKPSKYKLSYPAPQGAVIMFPLPSPAFASCTYLRPHTRLVEAPDSLQKLLLFLCSLCYFSLPLFLSFATPVFHLFSLTSRTYTHLLMRLLMFDSSLFIRRRDNNRENKAYLVYEGQGIVFRKVIVQTYMNSF